VFSGIDTAAADVNWEIFLFERTGKVVGSARGHTTFFTDEQRFFLNWPF
jgi:hypothetical protein